MVVTVNTGEVLVYQFLSEERRFVCIYREMVFKVKGKNSNQENPREVGNYITCSERNHFLVTSVGCRSRLYQVQASRYEQRLKIHIKAQELHCR